MAQVQILSAILIGFLIVGCTGSGFKSALKDGVLIRDGLPTQVSKENSLPQIRGGGQPGAIILGGVLANENSANPKAPTQVRISQIGGKNMKGEAVNFVRDDNKVIASSTAVDVSYLDQIGSRTDFVQFGCNTNSSIVTNLTRGLTEIQIAPDNTGESLSIKAKVVIFCGKTTSAIPYVTIIADQLAFIDANYELVSSTGVGFFTAVVNRLNLTGSNQISVRGSDSENLVLDGPALVLSAQKAIEGQGTLDVKTVGGNQKAVSQNKVVRGK